MLTGTSNVARPASKPADLGGAADQPGDVGEPDGGRYDPGQVVQPGERRQPRVRYFDDADIRLDGGERVVRGQHAGPGQGIEQGGLADVGQADDADGQAHPGRWPDSATKAWSGVREYAGNGRRKATSMYICAGHRMAVVV